MPSRQTGPADVCVSHAPKPRSELELPGGPFAALVEHGFDLVVIIGADQCLRYASPTFARIFGDEAAPHLGRPVWELIHSGDRERLGKIFEGLLEHPGAVVEFECRFLRADGDVRHVAVTQTNLLHNEWIQGFVGNVHEVTDLRSASDARVKSASDAVAEGLSLHRSLTSAVSGGLGMAGIAEVVHRVVGGTVVIEDFEGAITASEGEASVDVPSFVEEGLDRTALHASAFRHGDWLVAIACPNGEIVGAIGLHDPNHQAGEAESMSLEQAATVLAMELFRLRSIAATELAVWGDLATALLDEPDAEQARSHAAAFGYDIDRPHRAVLIMRDAPDIGPLTEVVRRGARAVGLSAILLTSRAAGVVLLIADDVDWEKFSRALSRGKRVHRVGIGARHSTASLRQSVAEAESALRLSPADVVRFDELGIWRFLAADADPERLRDYVHEWIGTLIDYDAGHRSYLVETLSAFLAGQGALGSIAEGLHIHTSTLKYRLGRIRELTGRDLRVPDERFNLELACRAHTTLDAVSGKR